MQTFYDVQQLLKKFGVFVYIGDRVAEIDLMEAEIKELYQSQLIASKDFQQSLLILRSTKNKLKNGGSSNGE